MDQEGELHTDNRQTCHLINKAGYSLMEVMIVVVIVAITAAVALPNMRGLLGKKDLDSISRQIFYDFQRARSEAISKNRMVKIQMKTGTGSWYQIDFSNGTNIVPRTQLPQGTTMAATTFPMGSTANTTGITPRGFATQQGTVTIRSTTAPAARRDRVITLSLGGAVSIRQ
jgi:prepilin-type N-terminal cleavage/methylation domain-containing protein